MKTKVITKRKLLSLILVLATLGLASCGWRLAGLRNDYNLTTESQRKRIHNYETADKREIGHVYKVNAEQLKNELAEQEKSLVYIFRSRPTPDYYLPLIKYKEYADKMGYKMFFVLLGYHDLETSFLQEPGEPFFVLDDEYYGTEYLREAKRFFENDLLNRPRNYKEKEKGRIYFFNRNRLVSIEKSLPES